MAEQWEKMLLFIEEGAHSPGHAGYSLHGSPLCTHEFSPGTPVQTKKNMHVRLTGNKHVLRRESLCK